MIKTVPYVPLSHPFVERLIGTIRREYLDQTLFWNEADLERKLRGFQDFYNGNRVHSSLGGATPAEMGGKPRTATADLKNFGWRSYCRGLFQLPVMA